ncbi:MAG TPA: hypothetical protein VMT76_07865 [Puia sp.]|nr:hypothetical protein [Puia sp.]
MKKTILTVSVVTCAILIFASCKKSNSSPSISGFWKGNYSVSANTSDTSLDTYGYCALLRNNGTCRFYDGADTASASKAEGTYSYSNNAFKATYTYAGSGNNTFSVSATVTGNTNYIQGSWGSGTNTSNGGGFYLYKQ